MMSKPKPHDAFMSHVHFVFLITFFAFSITPVIALEEAEKNNAKAKSKSQKVGTPPPIRPPLTPVDVTTLPDGTEQLDLYLLMGQSNMKGRGAMPEIPHSNARIISMHLRTDGWFVARHPLHLTGNPTTFEGHDNAGVGPGLTFAETLADAYPKSRIGLIPCAVGGSSINRWTKGQPLYENAIRRAKLAREAGPEGKTRIRGAIWLQGEADARPERIEAYPEKLAQMIKSLRADLGIENLPFIVSTIGEMRTPPDLQQQMNLILLDLPNHVENTGTVDARALKTHIGDSVHFDTSAQDEIGRRFAKEFLRIAG